MSLTVGTRVGPYEVTGTIGAGGMGQVYRARDTSLKRDVAIKVLPDEWARDADRLARFRREAEALAALNHPNIAAIYRLEETSDVTAIVMELVEGETLAEMLAGHSVPAAAAPSESASRGAAASGSGAPRALSIADTLSIARQIADALEAAHEQGVVHRDLKPANIKVRPDGTVKVLDFGLAKLVDPSTSGPVAENTHSPTLSLQATRAGVILGTAAYMSPEQARGKTVDKRADIWSFGCVLYEMLTGRRVFAGEDVSLTLSQVLQVEPDWSALPASVPPALRQLVARCLVKDPRRRLRDIGEARLLLDGPLDAPPASDAPLAPRAPSPRSHVAWIAALVGVGIVTGVGVWLLKPAATAPAGRVTRLSVVLPPGERVTGSAGALRAVGPPLALSPDGTRLAYVSNGVLWLRDLDAAEGKRLAGTDSGGMPFFSPNGQSIGFFSKGQLKKISVASGLVEAIADTPLGVGATWSSDGFIYFPPTNVAGLLKVSDRGGTPTVVTTLNRDAGEISHRFPHMLPGDRGLVFTVWHGPGDDEMELQALDLRTNTRRAIVPGAHTGRYVSSGHLVYSRAGQLSAIRFDLDRLEAVGQPVTLGIAVSETEGAQFALSDAGLLAYMLGTGASDRRLVWVDPAGRITPVAESVPARKYEDVALSRDGQRAALTASGSAFGIWIHDLVRQTQTPLTEDRLGSSQWPAWTPDGRIVYRGTRKGFRNVHVKSADGSGTEVKLTSGENMQDAGSVLPDGKSLTYHETSPSTGFDIWLRTFEDPKSARVIAGGPGFQGESKFSPNGRWIAYTSDHAGRPEVYLMPYPGLDRKITISANGGFHPRWSADSKSIFYMSDRERAVVVVDMSRAPEVGAPRTLFRLGDLMEGYDVAPDGRFLMIQSLEPPGLTSSIGVVLNFQLELERRLGRP